MLAAKQTGRTCTFSADDVRAIRKEYIENRYTDQQGKTRYTWGIQRDLAKKWGTNDRLIWCIVHKRLYKWVKEK